jgi:hypothetical protein
MRSWQCATCEWLITSGEGLTCEAFPDGIPEEIVTGQVDHSIPYGGDGGLVYLPRKEGTVE